jgi:hypothetical protein
MEYIDIGVPQPTKLGMKYRQVGTPSTLLGGIDHRQLCRASDSTAQSTSWGPSSSTHARRSAPAWF